MHAHPHFKERAAQRCMHNEKIKFRSTLFEGTDSWRLHDAISLVAELVAACYPLAVGGESGCE